jgi:hypothetical protein
MEAVFRPDIVQMDFFAFRQESVGNHPKNFPPEYRSHKITGTGRAVFFISKVSLFTCINLIR